MTTLAIVQARTSSRLPGKVLLPIGEKPMVLTSWSVCNAVGVSIVWYLQRRITAPTTPWLI